MPDTVAEPDLNDTDDGILVALSDGRNVPSNLADAVDKSRQYVHQRLKLLETADYVRNVGNGVYELQPGEVPDDDLDRLGITLADVTDLHARLQDALEARDDAQAKADRLGADLADCREQLDALEEQHGGRTTDTERLREAHAALARGLDRLPDDTPGRTPLADAEAILEGVVDDA